MIRLASLEILFKVPEGLNITEFIESVLVVGGDTLESIAVIVNVLLVPGVQLKVVEVFVAVEFKLTVIFPRNKAA